MPIMGSEDPESSCQLVVHFTSGVPMQVNTHVRVAREAILQWRKYVKYASLPEDQRLNSEIPFYVYNFLCANPEKDICASFIFHHVCGMIYYVENKNKEDQ